jgi:flavin-dependent dehydrogenase
MRRTILDRVLVDAASEAGADVRFGTRLTALTRAADGRVDGVILQDRSDRVFHVNANYVVGADGMRSTLAKLVGAQVYRAARHATAVLYGYWPGLPVDGYNWHYGEMSAAGVSPTNHDETLVFAGVPAHRWPELIAAGRFEAFHRILHETSPGLAQAIRAGGERPLTGFAGRAGVLPSELVAAGARRRCRVFQDPLTAHGITDAFRDAELLADAIVEGSGGAADYQRCRDEWSSGLFEITDRIASFEWTLGTTARCSRACPARWPRT